jgi:hypothetical protein
VSIRTKFIIFNVFLDEYTDEVLFIHEETLKKLQHKLEVARPLLKLIERREKIRKEKIELQQLTSDPKRLLDTKKSAAFLLRYFSTTLPYTIFKTVEMNFQPTHSHTSTLSHPLFPLFHLISHICNFSKTIFQRRKIAKKN